jgi:uncharacterized protein (DUF433 family)
MDFQKVLASLERSATGAKPAALLREYERLVRLTLENAISYNEPGSAIHDAARQCMYAPIIVVMIATL